jgi:hypothetical protein
MSFRQLEWLLRERLRAGLQRFRDDPAMVDRLFADLSENSRTHVKDWLLNHDVRVLLGFPRHMEDIPCWTIAMTGESPVRTPIGEMFEHRWSAQDEQDENGDLVRKNYAIYTMSQNADLTVLLSTVLQHILKSMRKDLDMEGFHQMIVAQQDALDLRVDFLPNYLYVRATALMVMTEDTVLYVDSTLPSDIEISLSVDLSLPATPPGP